MSICLIYLKIEGEPVFPRTEERLLLQSQEVSQYLNIKELELDYRKDQCSFGFNVIGQLDDIEVFITYPDSIEEDDDWNEVIPDDRYNLYIAFDTPFEEIEGELGNYYSRDYEGEYQRFCKRLRDVFKEKLPPHYHIICKHKDVINENFMSQYE